MNWAIFSLLAGILLPFALAGRILRQLVADRHRAIGEPVMLLRCAELLLLSLPITSAAPALLWLVMGTSETAGRAALDFMGTGWGVAKVMLTIAAVLFVDLVKPRMLDQLERRPPSAVWPTLAYVGRDLGVLAICLFLAFAASVSR